jgi:hypothetical protein
MSLAPPIVALPLRVRRPRTGPRRTLGLRRLAQLALVALGVLVVVTGLVIAPLPGPFGLPLAAVGLVMVLRNSYTARRGFVRMHRRHPRWMAPLRNMMSGRGSFAAAFWRLNLRVERLALRGRFSLLTRLRRRLSRRRGAAAREQT